jgi:NAD(P)-dependent dehydrogenase (short-subunit alcohol dehydrogenase family)
MLDPAFTLEQKVALVVGAANGIGRATALAFAAAGARVACADVEAPGARATAADVEKAGGQALPVVLDATDNAACRAAVAATVERFGGLDVLLYGAADHAAQGIRANTLSPGAVETRRMLRLHGDMETARRAAAPKHLVNRLGLPEEIARAAVYLASDASSFMTGSDLLIDGGYTAV